MNNVIELVRRASNPLLLSWGWRRWALSLFFGAISALAMPPLGWFPVLWVSLPAFVWLLDGTNEVAITKRRLAAAAAVGWWFGFGFHLAGLWWIGGAFLVEAETYAWLMPLAVLAMPAGLAIFTALATLAAQFLWRDDWSRILVLAIVLTSSDWARGVVLTGFPWNIYGHALSQNLILMQSASVFGAYGLSFFVILIFAAPACLIDETGAHAHANFYPVAAASALLALLAGFGLWRLSDAPDANAMTPGLRLRLIQPNIPQQEKWKRENRSAIISRYLDLSRRPPTSDVDPADKKIIIWPESAFPFLLTDNPEVLRAIDDLLDDDSQLITGAIRMENYNNERIFYNSVYVINSDGEIDQAYDKVHLVPFGEYLPFQKTLETIGLTRLVQGPGNFRPGFRRRLLKPEAAAPFTPLICYEAIFPESFAQVDERAEWILNVTNDAWFGESSGPYQHFAQSRLRAVEQGLPLVRVANTGISGVIDPKGRILATLGLNRTGVIDAKLPVSMKPTIYSRYRNGFLAVLLMVSLGLVLVTRYVYKVHNE